ncbi:MAG TPA: DUF1328 domain-containing protein [Candidatus Acidoferrum sp.]|nr:DUF1328 domain-containing protein [Candidatus Acidoferrum sp.]
MQSTRTLTFGEAYLRSTQHWHIGSSIISRARATKRTENDMLSWSIIFLVVALIAAFLGFAGIAGTAAWIAKVLFVVFLVLFLVSLIFGRRVR